MFESFKNTPEKETGDSKVEKLRSFVKKYGMYLPMTVLFAACGEPSYNPETGEFNKEVLEQEKEKKIVTVENQEKLAVLYENISRENAHEFEKVDTVKNETGESLVYYKIKTQPNHGILEIDREVRSFKDGAISSTDAEKGIYYKDGALKYFIDYGSNENKDLVEMAGGGDRSGRSFDTYLADMHKLQKGGHDVIGADTLNPAYVYIRGYSAPTFQRYGMADFGDAGRVSVNEKDRYKLIEWTNAAKGGAEELVEQATRVFNENKK